MSHDYLEKEKEKCKADNIYHHTYLVTSLYIL
jgi:hypothetical protein